MSMISPHLPEKTVSYVWMRVCRYSLNNGVEWTRKKNKRQGRAGLMMVRVHDADDVFRGGVRRDVIITFVLFGRKKQISVLNICLFC